MKSDFVKKGTERAPHRSLFNAAGYTDEELEEIERQEMLEEESQYDIDYDEYEDYYNDEDNN